MPDDTYQAVFDQRAANTLQNRPSKQRPVPLLLRLIRLGFSLGGALSPRTAGRVAYKLWFTPTRFPTPASETAVLESAQIAYHRIQALNIATYSWGQSGPTVLLVHGWSGRGTQLGAFVAPLVAAGYRVLSFDCPAHGRSSGKQTTLFEIADVLLALQESDGPFDAVITHSFGGPCLAVAMQQGFIASRVVNIAPPAKIEQLVRKFSATLAIPEKAENNFIKRFETAFGKDILERASTVNNVRDLDVPALVIHDENDDDIPWQEGMAVAQAWKKASFIKTTALGHRRILRDASIIAAVIDFIDKESG